LEAERQQDVFTLGSTKAIVRTVQGAPTNISGNVWRYGAATVSFTGDLVTGYANRGGVLKVSLGGRTNPTGSFGVGASKADVLAVQGTPTAVDGNLWMYESSGVSFQGDRVNGVTNASGNLRFR
jgi:hypothetical protein